ncbi:polyketide synthase [Thalassovita gelatinovora]|uniref:polyketide synthase n=1 Tax=Thalassovita gelatinovora TaxID=53501 RepID=UPI001113E2F2|nr:polyketide synthase [Thalassovita gelatinovora]QIZ80074.1 polyketide synthase [Thalassovita gelatinovora]
MKKFPILLGALICALTVALATTGFGHRFSSPAEVEADLYAAAFGLGAADLCGGSGDGGAGTDCEACRLLVTFHLPEPASDYVRLNLATVAAPVAMFGPRQTSLTRTATRPARAPPLV